MIKDNRFEIVRMLIEQGKIKSIAQIFEYVPKSIMSQELKTNNNRFTRLMHDPTEFKFTELVKIAEAFNISWEVIGNMAIQDEVRIRRAAKKNG